MDFVDYDWQDVIAAFVKENILGSDFSFSTKSELTITIDYIPKTQARKLYTYAKEQMDLLKFNATQAVINTEEIVAEPILDEEIIEEVEAEEAGADAEAAPAPEPVKKEPIVTTATLGGEALFARGSNELSEASQKSLAALVTQLGKFQEISAIDVVGHTDSTGSSANNQALSEARAAAVQDYLAAAYPDASMSGSGMGEDSPVATNSTPEGRAQNRRVEIQVTAKSITE